VTLNRPNYVTADAYTRGPAWKEITSRSIAVRTWDTITLNMIDIFSIVREIERRYGKIQSFEARRSADVESEYLKYMFITFQHSESKKAITSGQIIQVKSPRFDTVDNENISLEHLAWALDPVIRDRFLHGNIALPGEKDATLQTLGLPQATPGGSPVEYQVIDVKLEDGYPINNPRYDQRLTPKRRQELAQAIVYFGGFIDRPKSADGVLGRRPMDSVLEHWTQLLSPEDKAKLETNGEIDPSGAASMDDVPSSPGDVSKSPSPQEPQDFWFPRASQEESELIGLSMESTPPFKSYAPSDPSIVLAEALTPVQPDPCPPPPKSNPLSQPSKKERLLIAARKAAEAAALKEMQSSVISSVSSSDSVEVEEVTQAQSSGEPSIASEVPHLEMQERTEGSVVPPVEPDEPPQRQRGDIPIGSMHAVPEPKRPSARSWLKRWIG